MSATIRRLVISPFEELDSQDSKSTLYLGPWCFSHRPSFRFSDAAKYNLVPSPLDDVQTISTHARYIEDLTERIADALGQHINQKIGSSASKAYWRIRIIPWAIYWLTAAYERFLRIEKAIQLCNAGERISVNLYGGCETSFEGLGHAERVLDPLYNWILISDITSAVQPDKFVLKSLVPDPTLLATKTTPAPSRILSRKLRAYQVLRSCMPRSNIHLGHIQGLGLFNEAYLRLSYDPMGSFKKETLYALTAYPKLKDEELCFPPENAFEVMVSKIILKHVPHKLISLGTDGPKLAAWIGNDIYSDNLHNIRLAQMVEQGGKWISVQHGGGYGQLESFPVGKIEYQLSNSFITWGWKHKHSYSHDLVALPSPHLSQLPKHKPSEDSLTMVNVVWPPSVYRLQSQLLPTMMFEYFSDKRKFLKSLPPDHLKRVKYRPYSGGKSVGIDEELEISDCGLAAEQILWTGKLTHQLKKTKLVVLDHLGTTLCETMAMDVPTICFWRPEHVSVCEGARNVYAELKSAGILFHDPIEASQQVQRVWYNIDDWWNSPKALSARQLFKETFAQTSPTWRQDWSKYLRSLKRSL